MKDPRQRRPAGPHRRPRRTASVTIESIAAGGEGVAHLPDGRAIFVHRTAPGDEAEVVVTESRPRWARGRILRVITPGPHRREAPCPYYDRCGGCTLEHLEYEAQLEAKSRIVADAITRIGHIPVDPPEVVASPRVERYRNRVSFALRREGTGQVVAGFHALGDPDGIVDMNGACLLPEEAIARVWDGLRAAWGPDARRLPSGEQLRLTLRATAQGAVSLLVEGGFSPGRPEELIAAVEGLESVWHRPGDAAARLLAGAPFLVERWGDEEMRLAGEAFLQVNRSAARLLDEHLLDLAGEVAGKRIVDAYCGVGLLARSLARAGAEVIGIELDASAVAAARAADKTDAGEEDKNGVDLAGGGPERAEFRQGSVEELLPEALPASIVILNPPRGGVGAEVIEALLTEPPDRILYVSCSPATLARDLRRLAGRFRLEGVRSFDLFPQTAHVETVASLSLIPGQA